MTGEKIYIKLRYCCISCVCFVTQLSHVHGQDIAIRILYIRARLSPGCGHWKLLRYEQFWSIFFRMWTKNSCNSITGLPVFYVPHQKVSPMEMSDVRVLTLSSFICERWGKWLRNLRVGIHREWPWGSGYAFAILNATKLQHKSTGPSLVGGGLAKRGWCTG